jgi:wyosine [tRNA(Phe)-imidazoG37] synthetase (radical SAM superfamily)
VVGARSAPYVLLQRIERAMAEIPGSESHETLFEAHPRAFEENWYVYPVLSRRAGGISIGVNLNQDKVCNFRCVYCQVDRTEKADKREVEIERLTAELDRTVELVTSEKIYRVGRFQNTPPELRRLNDIALSGNGEPTTCPRIDEAVAACADLRRRRGLDDVKLVLITNATMFHLPKVQRAMQILGAANGQIWAKLDAGTEDYYRQVSRSAVPFARILENITQAAKARPIVIQSLFMRIHAQGPSAAELGAYCDRLGEILKAGGQIEQVQIHTVARPPAENWVTPLSNAELNAAADLVRDRVGPSVPLLACLALS